MAAIGPATAEALAEHGLGVEVVPREYRAEGLVERLRPLLGGGDRVLLPRAAQTRDMLVRRAGQAGGGGDRGRRLHDAAGGSERGGPAQRAGGGHGGRRDLHQLLHGAQLRRAVHGGRAARLAARRVTVASIGPITAATAAEYGLLTRVMPSEYTIPALARAIEDYCSRVPPPAGAAGQGR